MRALIDADILVYRVGWTTQNEPEGIARWRLDEMITRIQDGLKASDYTCFLTSQDKSNFRLELFPEYKAHRNDKPKPKHYLFLRNYLIETHNAVVVEGEEADDALGIEHTRDPENTIICTIDKDLDQIAGQHYNFVTLRKYTISPVEALRCFYEQVLVGDKPTDNVEGCPKIGEVKAQRILEGCQDENEMLGEVIKAYRKYAGANWADRLLLAGRLLWVRKHPGEEWIFRGSPVSKMLLEHFFDVIESTSDTKSLPSSTNSLPESIGQTSQ